jgi:hypothetical protein
MALGVIFTNLHFLRNLQVGSEAKVFVPGKPFQPCTDLDVYLRIIGE